MSYYVFSGAKCMCQPCVSAKGRLIASSVDNNVEFNGNHIINNNKDPDMSGGLCNLMTNPAVAAASGKSQPCIPVWIGNWINTEACVTSACGKPVILNTAIRICAYGGVMKITDPNNSVVMNTGKSEVIIDKNLKKVIENQKNKHNHNVTDENKKISDEAYVTALGAFGEVYAGFEDANNKIANDKAGDVEQEIKKETKSSAKLYNPSQDGVCSGKCPPEYENKCLLKKSIPSDMVLLDNENDSGTLKKNMYDNGLSPEDNETLEKINKISQTLGDKVECQEAHHHIIPGNQCLNKNKYLVTLANLYGYDVNNPNNGMCLPRLKKKDDKNITDEEWAKAKYDVIRGTGRQLHLGGHSFSSNMKENTQYIREDAIADCQNIEIPDYESTVSADLELIAQIKRQELSSSCRMNLPDEQKQKEKKDFQELMDCESQTIKEYILDYPTKTVNTNNYYVSKASLAYDISKTKSFSEFKQLTNGGK